MAFHALSSLSTFSRFPSPLLSLRRGPPTPWAAAFGPSPSVPVSDELSGEASHDDIFGDIDCAISLKRRKMSFNLQSEDGNASKISSFGLDRKSSAVPLARFLEMDFKMSVSELIKQSRIVPQSVYGDLGVYITGIQNDSRKVKKGDIFVCCTGSKSDGHLHLMDALKRGAVAAVASKDINSDEIQGCKALVLVNDTNLILPVLASTFYRNPSKRMSVIGITGTNGKTTTTHLVRSIFEAMALKVGMLGTVGYYIHGNSELEAPNTTPDAVLVQELMGKMANNGTEAVAMEVSSHGLALGRCNEIDFDVAVFMNLTRDHYDFHKTEEDYRNSKAKLFSCMLDPRRHRKVVNIDDPNASYFVARGNKDVPLVTFGMENMNADVFSLKYDLSFLETQVLISTPRGILEVSSRLIGRHNVYNILAAVAVGIAVGTPLENIKKGIEEVHGVAGRCEVIDEGQPFGVIVDYAHSPDALSRLLETLRELGARRIISVFGCRGESDKGKRPIMAKIATEKSDVVILTSDSPKSENPFDILDDMLAGVGLTINEYVQQAKHGSLSCLPNGHQLLIHNFRRVAIRAAVAMAKEGDVVVITGRGHETYVLEGGKKKYIDDREECREALQNIDKLHRAGFGKLFPFLTIEESMMSFAGDGESLYLQTEHNEPSLCSTSQLIVPSI